jgi:hypothetical protein
MKKLMFLVVAVLLVSTSAQAVFTPPDSANLKMWLDASGSVTKDGSNNVSSWNDMTANGNNATPPYTQPVWVANAINGMPAIRFTQATAAASNMLQAPAGMTSGLDLTVITVYQRRTDAHTSIWGCKNIIGGYGGSGRWVVMDSYSPLGDNNRIHFQFDSGNSYDVFHGGTPDQLPHM